VSFITDPKTIQLIREKKLKYGSPTVVVYSNATREIKNYGTAAEEHILHRFKAGHDAIVGEPAYTKEVDKFKAICDGDGEACALKLLEVNVSDHSLAAAVGGDTINQLTIVGFVKNQLGKKFKVGTLEAVMSHLDAQSKEDSCISKEWDYLKTEKPDIEKDQRLAISLSKCRVEKSGGELDESFMGDIINNVWQIKNEIDQKEKMLQGIGELKDKIEHFTA